MIPTPTSLRVGYVVKRYPRYSETFIVNEILAHEAAGLDVEIFSLLPPVDTHFQDTLARVRAPVTYLDGDGMRDTKLWAELVQVSQVCPNLWSSLAAARNDVAREVLHAARLARLVRERAITHLHAHFATGPTTVARLASRFAEVPYTFTAHAKDIFHESVNEDDVRRKLNDAAGVVTVSDFNVAHFEQHFGEVARRVRRIYNGLDLERFPYHEPARRPRHVVAVGRLVEKKGFDVLVDACAVLARRGCQFSCDIVGAGEQEAALRQQIGNAQLENHVRLVGPRPQQELVLRMRDASVMAAPSVVGADGNADGLPTVLLEAMAMGTPCVSTNVTGIPEVVRHGRTGLIVPQRDAAALADAIERLLDDADLRVQLASEGRSLIETEFDIQRNAARQRALFLDAQSLSRISEPTEVCACA